MIDLDADQIADIREAVYVSGPGWPFGFGLLHVNPEGQGKGVEERHRAVRADGSGTEEVAPDRLEIAAPDVLSLGPQEVTTQLAYHLVHGVAGEVRRDQSDRVGAWRS